MSTLDTTSTTSTDRSRESDEMDTVTTRTWPLRRFGGACLAAAPLLFTAGLATAPPQAEMTKESFAQSLIDHPTQAVVSANFLHYSWIAWVIGLIAVLGLVHGRGRGHAFTRVATVAAIVGCVQISGLLLGDLHIVALGGDGFTAKQITDALVSGAGLSATIWLLSAQVLAMLGLLAVFAGLARAGHVRWYLVALLPVGLVGGGVPLPAHLGLVLTVVCFAPMFLVARTLVRAPR